MNSVIVQSSFFIGAQVCIFLILHFQKKQKATIMGGFFGGEKSNVFEHTENFTDNILKSHKEHCSFA